jgi:chromosome segregation ATPase
LCSILVVLALVLPAEAQDSVKVPVEQLQEAKREIRTLRHRDSVNQEIIANLRRQVEALETVRVQDSIIIASQKKRLRIADKRLKAERKQVEYYRRRMQAESRRKWLYSAGSAIVVLLGALAGS